MFILIEWFLFFSTSLFLFFLLILRGLIKTIGQMIWHFFRGGGANLQQQQQQQQQQQKMGGGAKNCITPISEKIQHPLYTQKLKLYQNQMF